MNLDFYVVASNLMSLFILMAAGYFAIKAKILDERASPVFSSLLMKMTMPCTIFISIAARKYDPAFLHDGLTIIIAGLVIFSGFMYLSRYIAILLRVPKNHRGVWAFATSYTNSGYMGFPIALVLFGGNGLALAVMLNVAFNIVVFTLGALEVARDNPNEGENKISAKSIIFSVVNFATVLSMIFYFGQIKLPIFVSMPLNYLSNLTTPISMIIIGIALANSKFSELFTDIHAWTSSFISLLIYPAVLCLLLKFITISSNPLVSAILVLIIAMPAASLTTVFTEMYHGSTDFGARILFIQNLFCVVTIPLICMMI